MEMPTEDGLETAGPTFEYVPVDRRIKTRISADDIRVA